MSRLERLAAAPANGWRQGAGEVSGRGINEASFFPSPLRGDRAEVPPGSQVSESVPEEAAAPRTVGALAAGKVPAGVSGRWRSPRGRLWPWICVVAVPRRS